MSTARRSRWILASGLGHAAVGALLAAMPPASTAPTTPPDARAAEFTVEPPPPPEPHPAPIAPIAPPPVAARVAATVLGRAPTSRAPPAVPPPLAPPSRAPPAEPPPVAPPPVLRAADLLRPRVDSSSLAVVAPTPATGERPAPLFAGSTGTESDRARDATQGFVREALSSTMVREAPGVRAYLWSARRRVSEAWRPSAARVPNLAETLMAGFIAPERALRIFGDRMIRRQRQALAAPPPRLGGAADTIEAMGGVSGQSLNTNRPSMATDAGDESWRRNVRTTRAEVQVDQDEAGRVLDVRMLHPSGIPAFDAAALDAVRRGLDEQDPTTLPGGRRSRWSFTVVATRRLFAPSVGGAFDESRGWFRIEVPGQVTLRSRVAMESSAPIPPARVVTATPPRR